MWPFWLEVVLLSNYLTSTYEAPIVYLLGMSWGMLYLHKSALGSGSTVRPLTL